jgi:hypothetical protein
MGILRLFWSFNSVKINSTHYLITISVASYFRLMTLPAEHSDKERNRTTYDTDSQKANLKYYQNNENFFFVAYI